MTEKQQGVQPIRHLKFDTIWLVPLIAIMVAGWMLYADWASKGPEIQLIAPNAEGMEAGKTTVKELNIVVGKVTDIRINDNFDKAIITVQMNQGTEGMLKKDSKFWVVKPRIGTQGVSGLETLLSGSYIDIDPGTEGKPSKKFTLLEEPPLSSAKDEGIRITLNSLDNSKLSVGTLIHFRGFPVGHIEKIGFDIEKSAITYQAFVRAPYDSLVNDAVQFWMTPAISLKSSSRGVELRLDSFETLISGGISFGLLNNTKAGDAIDDLDKFRLYATKEDARNNHYDHYLEYIFLFTENISGLELGSPIEFHGVRVGTVQLVPYIDNALKNINEETTEPVIAVLARIEPQRIHAGHSDKLTIEQLQALMNKRVNHGLRATLRTSNLLTGAKSIDLDVIAKPQEYKWKHVAEYKVFPTVPSSLENIEEKINSILDMVAKAPINQSLNSFQKTMDEATITLKSFESLAKNVDGIVNTADAQQIPQEITDTLREIKSTLASYEANGQIGAPLSANLKSLERSLNELQPLLKELREDPNSLIFDKAVQPDIQPNAAN